MDLKELLGEELYDQVMEKAGDEKVAVVSDGSYIPKEKFDDERQKAKDYKSQLEERDEQLNDLQKKAKGNEDLQSEIDRLKDENKQTVDDYESKLQAKTFDYELDKALAQAKARNPKAVKGLLDKEAIKLDGEKLLGLDEQLETLKESDSYLFAEEEPKGLKGRQPQPPNNEPQAKGTNPFSKDSANYTEQGRLIRQEPEKARQFISQAGMNPANYGL